MSGDRQNELVARKRSAVRSVVLGLSAVAWTCLCSGCDTATVARILSTSPSDGETNTSADRVITVTFDRAALPDTLESNITPEVAFDVVWSSGDTVLTITPSADLAADTLHTVTIERVSFADGAGLSGRFAFSFTTGDGATDNGATDTLADVRYWAYQIQGLENDGAVDALVASRYDLLVIDPVRSDRENTDFDTANMVRRLHDSPGSVDGSSKLVIAYIDIGEAEDWRSYWASDWTAPANGQPGNPDFLITVDPDGWSGNYPVAFWDTRWKEIMVTGDDSMLQQLLDDGFDGIYMDWVEAYSDETVMAAATTAGLEPANEMVKFIREIRDFARQQDPDFLVIPQNSTEILEFGGQAYLDIIDAIAQEQVYFDGEADTEWADANTGDQRVPDEDETEDAGYSRTFFTGWLDQYLDAGKVVLTVDYAAESANVAEAYQLSSQKGYIPYVSLRSLDRLTDTPPAGLP